ncbi:MAG TPA: YqaJ viral recombinase family protein [Candidatus Acidoferrales bacterium]|nr:YqaJ viral recombinase family protein [Candidatus Acidoferrales bacterium]
MKRHPDNFIDCVQGSAEWFDARLGRVTASRVRDALSMLKRGGSSEARERYKIDLLTEMLTGKPVEHYVSPAMDFGTEYEPVARSTYEMRTEVEVELIGFVVHPSIIRAGASPDGLVGEDGLVEIKVPNGTTHLRYMIDDVVPEEYAMQMLWQMACTGRKWCDFVSYDPRIPDDFSLFVKRLWRDDEIIKMMEDGVRQFITEINQMADLLLERRGGGAAFKMWQQISEAVPEQGQACNVPRAIIPEMA